MSLETKKKKRVLDYYVTSPLLHSSEWETDKKKIEATGTYFYQQILTMLETRL